MAQRKRKIQRNGPWYAQRQVKLAAALAAAGIAVWLFTPSSSLKIAVPDPQKPRALRLTTIRTGAKRYGFPLWIRWLDTQGLRALRRGEFAVSREVFSRSLEIFPNNPRALSNRGTAHAFLWDLDEARADYRTAIGMQSNLEKYLLASLSRVYHKRALIRIKQKKLDAARRDLESAVELDAQNGSALLELGSLDIQNELFDDCIVHLSRVIRIDALQSVAYSNRGACYSALGKHAQALNDLNKAISLNPNRAKSYGTRAGVHIWMKNYEAALQDATKAIRLNSGLKKRLQPLIVMANAGIKTKSP